MPLGTSSPTRRRKRMPTFDLDFEVYCANCGAGLCNQSDAETTRNGFKVTIAPCKRCLEDADYEGYLRGQEEADKP